MAERIIFDRSLYLPEAVEAAAAAYAEHAQVQVTQAGDTVVVEIGDVVEHDPQLVAHAFGNHVLYETITRMRQADRESA